MNDTKLYHRAIYWKSYFDEQSKQLLNENILFSKHTYNQMKKADKSHCVDFDLLCDCVERVKTKDIKPFEVETTNDIVSKCVVREKYNDNQDICLVFRKELLVTCYLNSNNDSHKTLDITKYEIK